MKLQIKAAGFELTPALHQLVESKLNTLSKFLKNWEKNSEVILRVEIGKNTKHHNKGMIFYAEGNLDLPGLTQKLLRIEEVDEDLRTAVDNLKDRLKNELLRVKKRLSEREK